MLCKRAWIVSIFLFCVLQMHAKPRVVVVGFDGADPSLIEKWIDKLPHIKKLKDTGTVCSMKTTNPSHSPVAWATFATGNNPGKHRVFGFLKRNIGKYKPEYAVTQAQFFPLLHWSTKCLMAFGIGIFIFGCGLILLRKRKHCTTISSVLSFISICSVFYILWYQIPQEIPYPISLKKGSSFWTIAAEKGIKTDVVMAPIAFPAEKVCNGHLLCGFGVPDLLRTNGTWNVYTSTTTEVKSTETGGWIRPFAKKDNSYLAEIIGPSNTLVDEEYARWQKSLKNTTNIQKTKEIRNHLWKLRTKRNLKAKMVVKKINNKLEISIGKQKQYIALEEWSNWFYLRFELNSLISIYGAIRIYVSSIDPHLNIYVTPIQFSPKNVPHNVKISYPGNFAGTLHDKVGMFPTLGWAASTNALKDEMIGENAFDKDLKNIVEARNKIFNYMLDQQQDLLVSVFYFTDRAGHMYWRFIDKKHPLYDKTHEGKLLKVYQKMDRIIGDTLKKLNQDDILCVVSDHGFASFRWQVNINTWLLKNGYLFLKEGIKREDMQVRDLFERARLLQEIDWSRTKAYSIGLGKIFINLKGREPEGIVTQNQYEKVRDEITRKLTKFEHLGQKIVFQTYTQRQAFIGPYAHEAADIVIGFNRGYRVSWQTSLGGVPTKIIEANKSKWSGDHCSVDPSLVPGVFMCNKKILKKDIALQDIAPSVLGVFSIDAEGMDGSKFEIKK